MYWYNPTIHDSERVAGPSDDDGAVRMLAGHPNSARFVSEYAELRRSGAPIELALVPKGEDGPWRIPIADRTRLPSAWVSGSNGISRQSLSVKG